MNAYSQGTLGGYYMWVLSVGAHSVTELVVSVSSTAQSSAPEARTVGFAGENATQCTGAR